MKNKIFSLFLLFSPWICMGQISSAYLVMDVNGCSNCLQTATMLSKTPELLNNISFLFNGDDVTLEQAKNYLSDELKVNGEVVLNSKIYYQYVSAYPNPISRKMPHIVLYNNLNERIERSFSIDSIIFFESLINNIKSPNVYKYINVKHELESVKKLIGYKVLEIKDGNLVVNTYQNPRKIYIYNTPQKMLDSLVIDLKLEEKILSSNNVKIKNLGEAVEWHKQSGFANFSSFVTNQTITYDNLSGVIITRYYNYENQDSIIHPTQIFQYFDYSIKLRKLKLYSFSPLWGGDSIDDFPVISQKEYYQDLDYPFKDSLDNWYAFINYESGEMDSVSKTKQLVRFHYNNQKKMYSVDSVIYNIVFDTIESFSKNRFNNPQTYFAYRFNEPFFYYNDAPLIRNVFTNQTIDLSNIQKGLTWVYDLVQRQDGLYILIKTNEGRKLLILDKKSNKLLSKIDLQELDKLIVTEANGSSSAKSNLVLDSDLSIYFIDKKGIINQLKLVN
jgi:hypothetical protein